MKRNDLVGQVFGRLTVVGIDSLNKKQNVVWRCTCSCGNTTTAYAYDLRRGRVVSCGCYARESKPLIHGQAGAGKRRSPTYSVWAAMVQRCSNPKDRNYKNYGGRGVTVCDSWRVFANFFADMGQKPAGMTLERIDNNKGYSPGNCKWASRQQQMRNTRANVWVAVDGVRMVFKDAAKLTTVSRTTLYSYLSKHNLTHQEVIDLWLPRENR